MGRWKPGEYMCEFQTSLLVDYAMDLIGQWGLLVGRKFISDVRWGSGLGL